jgi:hypothetical protein
MIEDRIFPEAVVGEYRWLPGQAERRTRDWLTGQQQMH